MSAALACGPSENTQGPAAAQEQDNGAGCSPRGGEMRAGTADFSAATTRRKAVRPAVKPEAESAPGKSQTARHPPRPRPASPGRDGPGVAGRRAHGRPQRAGDKRRPRCLRAATLGACGQAPGNGTEACRTSCRSAAVEASTTALVEAGSGGLLHPRALPPGTWAPQGGHRCPSPLQGPRCPEHAARRGGAQGTGSLQRVGMASGRQGAEGTPVEAAPGSPQ